MDLKVGIYKHFKGSLYKAIGTATHSETKEKLVVYHPINSPSELWTRPIDMFNETIERDGRIIKRFSFHSD